jgi:2-oxoisovalerate dehydrogenase E1 component
VRNTPLCESGVIGTALGASLEGYKSMVEMQFADFVSCGFNQIINNLQNSTTLGNVRCCTDALGGGSGAGPFLVKAMGPVYHTRSEDPISINS